jgi:hypothetical protein
MFSLSGRIGGVERGVAAAAGQQAFVHHFDYNREALVQDRAHGVAASTTLAGWIRARWATPADSSQTGCRTTGEIGVRGHGKY